MLEFIAQNGNNIVIFASVLVLIGLLFAITSATRYSTKYSELIGYCMMMTGMMILAPLIVGTKGSYPVSNAEWKTIYKNNLNANMKITYDDFSDKHSISTNRKQNIEDFQSALNKNGNVMEIKLTATKGNDSVTKNVLLEQTNIVAKEIDPTNAYIEKIEYRPIEGTTLKVFGVEGKTSKSSQEGEIRITFKSNTNKQLEALFKD